MQWQTRMRTVLYGLMWSALAMTTAGHANDTDWTGSTNSDFFNATNWTDGVPSSFDDLATVDGGNNLPIQIAVGTGTVNLGAVRLGSDDQGGSIVQLGGIVVIDGSDLAVESAVGDLGTDNSSWVLRNDASVLYGDPYAEAGTGLGTDGNGQDFDVGKSTPEGALGSLELHDNAAFRIGDDLKLADGSGGHASLLMDGNSQFTVGSGISVSGVTNVRVAGNALLVTGNSAGPGDSEIGRTNEGYLTLSTGGGEEATVDVLENGKIYARTLQQRGGVSTMTLRDNGEFHVFDVFEYAEPNLGNATVVGSAQGSAPQRTSHLSQSVGAESIVQLFDQATMTVDSNIDDAEWSGLAISGGDNRGASSDGGYTLIEVNDQATFAVAQDLNMTLGISDAAESILKVRGPDATVIVGGDLRMALSTLGDENPGAATLQAVITGATHSTISVGGTALIGNGQLLVQLDGYSPVGGEIYQLITAEAIEGSEFLSQSLPNLPPGLNWDLAIDSTSVTLLVLQPGDFNRNGVLDANDMDLLTTQVRGEMNPSTYDLNGDGVVNDQDREYWINDLKKSYFGDSNLDGEFSSTDLVDVFQAGEYEDGVPDNSIWATGDWDGDGEFDSADFVLAFAEGGYELGPRTAVSAVPEPATIWLAVIVVGCLACTRRRMKS